MQSLISLREADGAREPWSKRCRQGRARRTDYTDLREPQRASATSDQHLRQSSAPSTSLLAEAARLPDPDDAIDLIYTRMDEMLRDGAFSEVDAILDVASPSALSTDILLAAVSVTSVAAAKLSRRSGFVARVRQHLVAIEPTRVEELLGGIE